GGLGAGGGAGRGPGEPAPGRPPARGEDGHAPRRQGGARRVGAVGAVKGEPGGVSAGRRRTPRPPPGLTPPAIQVSIRRPLADEDAMDAKLRSYLAELFGTYVVVLAG